MGWHELPEAQALGEEEAIGVVVGGQQIALCRSGGTVHAIGDVCTHQYALLSEGYVEDGCIECPLHQGKFALRTGAPLAPPVTQPVRVYALRNEAGKLDVELPE